jgi:hypothetical protein
MIANPQALLARIRDLTRRTLDDTHRPMLGFARGSLGVVLLVMGCDANVGGTNAMLGSEVHVASTGTPLRIMAANTTSGNSQSYDPGHGTRMFEA